MPTAIRQPGFVVQTPQGGSLGSLSSIRNGSRTAYTALFKEWTPRLIGYFVRLGVARDQAEELAQETLSRTWEKRESYRDGTPEQVYLFAIARNLYVDALRKTAVRLDTPETSRLSVAPDEMASERELGRRIAEVVGQLELELRETWYLIRGEGLKYREAAEILDLSVKGVEARMRKILDLLTEALSEFLTE